MEGYDGMPVGGRGGAEGGGGGGKKWSGKGGALSGGLPILGPGDGICPPVFEAFLGGGGGGGDTVGDTVGGRPTFGASASDRLLKYVL